MRKLITLGMALATTLLLYGQSAALEVEGSPQICAGYTAASQIKVRIKSSKVSTAPVSRYTLAYVWTAEHANGTRVWFSNKPYRWVPITWPGQYRVSVTLEYILPGRTRPFMVSPSSGVFLYGLDCNTP
ncbi:MAG TPA: hypothetical protein PK198_11390 [Saprospiraceae bacterium]|jgi:hypothetical protein|nr:hypothetical protein [Saprospiraceae bacterium]HRF39387.1 hypothetical protein [Saprospiraceae bacterium]HRJ15276.1 hypothetical protein [Saprospiraceae bacterium]HRK80193.1 hypothetical protein [Saprospiraceae bacterium]